jgi:glycosyltransferase involved in cell wall biosynthesis
MTAGILNRGKNIDMLIKSLPSVGTENLFLVIVGDGSSKQDFSYINHLRELIRKLGLDHRVIFTGWLEKEELWRIYLVADLFVLPSKSEGMPNAMLEALGLNLPCFGSNISGIRDILRHEELMFDLFDEKALAQKIEFFFSDKVFSDYITSLCQDRKRVLSFDWKGKAYEMMTERLSQSSGNYRL